MANPFSNYYFLKDLLSQIPEENLPKQPDNHLLFKYALFPTVGEFYALLHPLKKDHFSLHEQLLAYRTPIFIYECLEQSAEKDSPEQRFFAYTIALSHFFYTKLDEYLNCFSYKKKKRIDVEKNIDTYFFMKNEKMPITQVNLGDYFFDSFAMTDEEMELIHLPMIKAYGFFCSDSYFNHAYLQAHRYYSSYVRSKSGIKRIPYFFYDLLLNHRKGKRKASTFLYSRKIDTTVLNLQKKTYSNQNASTKDTLDEFYDKTLKDAKKLISLLNKYFSTGNSQPIVKYYHIDFVKENNE